MKSPIERRLEKLEAEVATEKAHRMPFLIFPGDGESHKDAIVRAGHQPGDPSKLFICIVSMRKDS